MSFVGTNGVDTHNGTADRAFAFAFAGDDSITLTQTFDVIFGHNLISIFGGANDDTLSNVNSGSAVSQAFIDGGSGNDTMTGAAFDDGFRDGSGNDTVHAGAGVDTVYLPYNLSAVGNFAFTAVGSASSLTLNGSNGMDTYNGVEFFQFADGSMRTAQQVLSLAAPVLDQVAATTATPATIAGLQPRFGRVEAANDQDWFRADLSAGVSYTILLYGKSMADPFLRLFDNTGALLTSDDDSAGNRNSVLTVAAGPTNKSVFLSAGGAFGGETGTYEIAIFANQAGSPLFNSGKNVVSLTSGGSSWDAQGGDDVVVGSALADRLLGSDGFDGLYGGAGDDFLHGGANEDIVAGDAGNDVLEGGAGGDILSELAAGVGSGNDILYGGDNVDIMYAGDGDDLVYGGADTANNYANLGSGNDYFLGAAGTDVVVGGDGNDVIEGAFGHDSLYGENGNDRIYGGLGIDLLSGSFGNDELFGGGDNDQLVGDDGNDLLDGGEGTDVLYGGAGDDILRGGAGAGTNAMYGGAGNDTFQVGAGTGADYIYDFQLGDRIVFQTGHFSQLPGGHPEGRGLVNNITFAGGNSTITVYTASANPGDATVTYTLTSTVVVVGVNVGSLNFNVFDINGIF